MLELNEPKKVADSAAVIAECDALDGAIAELRAAYEQYFLGIEKRPPTDKHNALKKRLQMLRNTWTRQTAAKFRVQSLNSKFATYERLWARTIQEIENGTYVRDVRRAKRKAERQDSRAQARPERSELAIEEAPLEDGGDSLEAAMANAVAAVQARQTAPVAPVSSAPSQVGAKPAPVIPSVAPAAPTIAPVVPPVAPASAAAPRSSAPGLPKISPVNPSSPPAAAVRPAAVSQAPTMRPMTAAPMPARPVSSPPSSAPPSANLSDDKLRAVYDAFVKAKRRCNEDTSSLSYEQVATSLRKQVPELMKQHKAKAVEFKVVIKDGKAVLRAVPKDG